MKVYNLPHDTYCKALGRCACTIHSGRQDRRFCSSLTLASEASVSDLPQAVLSVREISLAIKAGQLAVKAENKKRAKRKKVKEVTHE